VFPLEVYPDSLRKFCLAAAASLACPVDYLAVPALVLAGGAIGMSVNLDMTNVWRAQPHLYAMIVGPPGSTKSPALDLMGRPFREIDRELDDEYKAALANWMPDDPRPIQRHLLVDDATREAIGALHAENPRGLIHLRDESVAWVKALDAYRQGRGGDAQFWLSVNSGSSVKINRKSTRESLLIERPCIAVIGTLTPSSLNQIRVSDGDDGWVDRILFCYPEPVRAPLTWDRPDVRAKLSQEWGQAVRRLWQRQPSVKEGRPEPQLIHLDDNAKERWADWYSKHWLEVELPDFQPDLAGPWAKLEGFTARFVLILALLHQAYENDSVEPRDVDGPVMDNAGKLARYFKSHFRRAMHRIGRKAVPDVVRLLIPRLAEKHKAEFKVSDMTRDYSTYLRDPDDLDAAMSWLERHNFARVKTDPGVPATKRRGKPASAAYEVNPRLFEPGEKFIEELRKHRA
jgi:hypothetical protein